jgi:DNA-binding transcriptional LysR family regulator
MAKAAAALAISQPAVSKAIADLEHTVGLRLLDRTRQGIEATTYGRALVKHGTTVFDELKQAAQELTCLPTPQSVNCGSAARKAWRRAYCRQSSTDSLDNAHG